MIRELIAGGAAVYLVIALTEGILTGSVLYQAGAIAALLVLLGALLFGREEPLHRAEQALLWCTVLAIAGYALVRIGGVF
ncbi:hypothetical protein E2N92_02670 [Methanofollis formosanus]|uniref:Uncharacterized protein n=1 Tax=Methanofollis formosanus TaxID=299308 RepID=A0A8G0ZZ58_9EURY|nr:hypothetical protein [Methanofollis formosanus]QYZ78412.1 hypothetical protein E2N92_02670 [Methanofollis formosanus]